VLRPNYATNLETPRAIGADVEYLDLSFDDGWALDTDRVAEALRPETRLDRVPRRAAAGDAAGGEGADPAGRRDDRRGAGRAGLLAAAR
jgi:hypothetical protein